MDYIHESKIFNERVSEASTDTTGEEVCLKRSKQILFFEFFEFTILMWPKVLKVLSMPTTCLETPTDAYIYDVTFLIHH